MGRTATRRTRRTATPPTRTGPTARTPTAPTPATWTGPTARRELGHARPRPCRTPAARALHRRSPVVPRGGLAEAGDRPPRRTVDDDLGARGLRGAAPAR